VFSRIAVAYNDSPVADRALACAIWLAKSLDAEVKLITVMPKLPAYSAFAEYADPSLSRMLDEERIGCCERLHEKARASALAAGVKLITKTIDGPEVDAIIRFLLDQKADLLVVGLRHHNRYLSRLWSTVYELAQEAPCSVLGVQ
jgi:nucleotide-binding universal stress UspA family protein